MSNEFSPACHKTPSRNRFHGNIAAVVSHGLVKERVVPPREIDRAIERMRQFEANPKKHTLEEF
jgi:hypothetical protein